MSFSRRSKDFPSVLAFVVLVFVVLVCGARHVEQGLRIDFGSVIRLLTPASRIFGLYRRLPDRVIRREAASVRR